MSEAGETAAGGGVCLWAVGDRRWGPVGVWLERGSLQFCEGVYRGREARKGAGMAHPLGGPEGVDELGTLSKPPLLGWKPAEEQLVSGSSCGFLGEE